MSIFVFLY